MSVKKTYQINTNRGVDATSSPLGVSLSRASYMRNMINDGGINKKRHGWNEIARFKDRNGNDLCINGIFEYVHPTTRDKSLIVYAGTQFFKCDYDFTVQEKITVESGANGNGEKCKAYYKDGLLWIIGCGDYLVYDGTKIQKVENSKYAYAPVTTIGITNDGKAENFEDLNLITNRRINKIIGSSGFSSELNEYSSSYGLDGLVDFNKEVKVTVEISVGTKENEVDIDASYEENGKSIPVSGRVVLEYTITEEKTDTDYKKVTYKGKDISLKQKNSDEKYNAYIYLENWPNHCAISFESNVITPIQEYSNITVEYYADYERSIDLTVSDVYTQSNGVDLLLVANRGNVIFYNGLDSADCEYSFGYIPVEKFITFGTDRDEISAIVPMADCVGVFKGKSFYRVTFTFSADSANYEADYVPQITVSTDSNGCINQFVNCGVNGDTIIFDGAGVYGVDFSAQQKSLRLRSSNINKVFEKYSKEQIDGAVACEHEGRYYLFISGDVYIADSRFKVYESNRLDTSFEYEWWIWDNCPASFVCSIEGKLFLGRKNGRIAVFDGGYSDRSSNYFKNSTGDFLYYIQPRGRTNFTFNEKTGLLEGSRIFIKNAYTCLGEFLTYLENGTVKAIIEDEELIDLGIIYIGMQVYFEFDMRGPFEVTDINIENGVCVAYINTDTCNEFETLIISAENRPYIVTKEDFGFSLLDEYYINSYKKEQCYLCVANSWDMVLIIKNEKNVECEYHTPVLDLGTNLSLKTLNQLLVTVSNDTEGLFEVGYRTNRNNTFIERNVGSGFDFNNFDFNTLSFDGDFYKTHVKRVFERNFNYILFKFASGSDKPFGVENFSCVYTTNSKLLKSDK